MSGSHFLSAYGVDVAFVWAPFQALYLAYGGSRLQEGHTPKQAISISIALLHIASIAYVADFASSKPHFMHQQAYENRTTYPSRSIT